jgi:hypothetical protein
MAKVTFDGPNRLIIVDNAITELDVQIDLYSDWKEWVQTSDNSKYFQAFRTVAGDPIPGGRFISGHYFLQNQVQPDAGTGWRIRPHEADHELTLIGNLWPEDEALATFVPTVGAYTVLVNTDRSADTITLQGGDAAGIATAVWDKAHAGYESDETKFGGYLLSIPKRVTKKLFPILFGTR